MSELEGEMTDTNQELALKWSSVNTINSQLTEDTTRPADCPPERTPGCVKKDHWEGQSGSRSGMGRRGGPGNKPDVLVGIGER